MLLAGQSLSPGVTSYSHTHEEIKLSSASALNSCSLKNKENNLTYSFSMSRVFRGGNTLKFVEFSGVPEFFFSKQSLFRFAFLSEKVIR